MAGISRQYEFCKKKKQISSICHMNFKMFKQEIKS